MGARYQVEAVEERNMDVISPAYYLDKLWYLLAIPLFGPPGMGAATTAGLAWKTPAVYRPAGPMLKSLEVQQRLLTTPPGPEAELVAIPGGKLKRCPSDGQGECETVAVAAFRMDRTEVTVGRFAQCVKAGKCQARHFLTFDDTDFCNLGAPGRVDHPINCVAYFAAKDYCSFAGKRLPSVAEWQYAARGESERAYPWGSEEPSCDRATYHGKEGRACGMMYSAPVSSFPKGASAFGLLGMAGNVMEWTSAIAAPPDDDPEGKKIPIPDNPRTKRNFMGGSFADAPHVMAIDYICYDSAKVKNISLGIRCAADPQ